MDPRDTAYRYGALSFVEMCPDFAAVVAGCEEGALSFRMTENGSSGISLPMYSKNRRPSVVCYANIVFISGETRRMKRIFRASICGATVLLVVVASSPAYAPFLKEIPVPDLTFAGQFYTLHCTNKTMTVISSDGHAGPLIEIGLGSFRVDLSEQIVTLSDSDGNEGPPIKVHLQASRTEDAYSKWIEATWGDTYLSISIHAQPNEIITARSALSSPAATLPPSHARQVLFGDCAAE
tara:strand:+ start:90120 stop:90830 length:711 start_codon:yes stop_codon:yes gene_type:complete